MKAFARWRFRVWDRRLTDWRKEWNRAETRGPGAGEVGAVPAALFWERLVTKAMAKRTLWRKRAGIDLRLGHEPETHTARKLSDPGDRPEA